MTTGRQSRIRLGAGGAHAGSRWTALAAATAILAFASSAQAAWYNASWTHRKELTLNGGLVPAAQANFPVLVSLTDAQLGANAQADGDDILFTAVDGTTKLDHEIESYTSPAGTLVAWVEVPALASGSNTTIYMYYGNAAASNQQNVTGVWSNGFRGVWHLDETAVDEGTTATHFDSTSNSYDGTQNGNTNAAGRIGRGQALDGNDYIQVAGLLGSPGTLTLSGWANLTVADTQGSEVISLGDHVALRLDDPISRTTGFFYDGAAWQYTQYNQDYAATGWHFFAYTFDDAANAQRLYVDGVLRASTAFAASINYAGVGANTFFGRHGNAVNNKDFTGTLDELRVSAAARPLSWIQTEYNNQANQGVGAGRFILGMTGEQTYAYAFFKPITIDRTKIPFGCGPGTTLTDYPMLFSVNDPDLAHTSSAGDVTDLQGDDIIFKAHDDATCGGAGLAPCVLDHEIEAYVSASGRLVAWVRIPSVNTTGASSDTVIYVYYGNPLFASPTENPTGVWDSNYAGVWHLSGDFVDSTSNPNDGTNSGSTDAAAKIANGRSFNGTTNYINDGSNASIDNVFATGGTAEAWINPAGCGENNWGRVFDKGHDLGWSVFLNCIEGTRALSFVHGSSTGPLLGHWISADNVIQYGQWQHVAVTFNKGDINNNPTLYVNGLAVGNTELTTPTGAFLSDAGSNLFTGNRPATDRTFNGIIDEPRISNTARSACWIGGEFNNHDNPGDITNPPGRFYTIGAAAATAVELLSFEAVGLDGAVVLRWQTASELDNLGFHLHRSTSEAGPWTRITSSLIPGLGSSPVGRSYSWRDTGLVNGQRYYYRLEDIDTASVSTFHGPVSALPLPGGDGAGGGGGGGAEGGEGESGGGAGSEGPPEGSTEPCPTWVLSMHGDSGSESLTCTRYGEPDSVSLVVVSRSLRFVELELRTGGFWVLHEGDGTVRAYARGFDTPTEAEELALPLRRTLVEAVVGRKVRLVSAEGLDLRSFTGLRPAAVGVAELGVSRDGTVRPVRRTVGAARVSRGYMPGELARLRGTAFQGERKSAVVEVMPLRYDGSRGELVLAGRVRVRLSFEGVEAEETGSGSRGRLQRRQRRPVQEVLAQVYTTTRGLYGVRFEEVFPGLRRGVETSFLRLQREGEAVPFRVEPVPSAFRPGSALYFHADRVAKSTDFTGEVAYELVRSREGEAMEAIAGTPEGVPVVKTSTGQVSYEVNRLYQSGLLEAEDVWQWEAMTSGVSRTKGFTLEGVDSASTVSGRVVVELQGGSESGTVVDHHVQVFVNGTYAGETSFAGKVPQRMEVEVPASVLREGTNEVQVLNVGDTGVSSLVYLDWFTVEYPQVSQVRGGVFEGVIGEGGTAEVGGVGGPAVVVDVTGTAKWVSGFVTEANAVRFRGEAGHRYEVVSAEGLLSPRVVRPEGSTLRSEANQADYLLIAPASFLGAAEPLLVKRASEGLSVKAVSLEEIATVFGHGTASGEAMRSFVSWAYHRWTRPSPRYVVLLGDATFDPRHFVATSWASPLPALWGKTSYLWTARDPVLGAVNGEDEVPDVAMGRIPATTVEQAGSLIAKLLAWEDSGQGLTGKAALVADNPDVAGDFEWNAEDIRASFLGDRETEVLKVGELGAGTRAAIQGELDGGLSLLSYVGHGGSAVWASENVWNSWDAGKLLAQTRQPLLLTLNCLNGYFVATSFESLSESLVKVEGRGAIAALSPSGLSVDAAAHQYHRAVVQELVSGSHERLGDAILAAQGVYAETGLMPELLSIYHLFGDPAMRIR